MADDQNTFRKWPQGVFVFLLLVMAIENKTKLKLWIVVSLPKFEQMGSVFDK